MPQLTVSGGAITIPTTGSGSPYPSIATAASGSGTVSDVNVTLTTLSHTSIRDISVLLESPSGARVSILSRRGPDALFTGTLTFDDQSANAPLQATVAFVSGTYQPSGSAVTDTFPGLGSGTWATSLSAFNGTAASGQWKLYIIDPLGGDSGSLASWTLVIGTDPCASFVFPYTLSGANNLARVANLRSAIECANANGAGTDIIDLNAQSVALEANNVYATYAGPTGLPQITSSVTIRNGTVLHDLSAGGTLFRTFDILGSGTLTLQNVVLQGDMAPTPGGAFYNRGTVNVSQTRISGYSTSNRGGVLFNDTAAVANFNNALLYSNNAVFAHAIDNLGSVSIINSTFDKHTSISNFGAVLEGTGYTVRNSIFWNPGSGPT